MAGLRKRFLRSRQPASVPTPERAYQRLRAAYHLASVTLCDHLKAGKPRLGRLFNALPGLGAREPAAGKLTEPSGIRI